MKFIVRLPLESGVTDDKQNKIIVEMDFRKTALILVFTRVKAVFFSAPSMGAY